MYLDKNTQMYKIDSVFFCYLYIYLMFSRSGLVGAMSTRALQEIVGISVLNFNWFLAVSSSARI